MNVIFLDVDGVLNNNDTVERIDRYVGIDKRLFGLLSDVLKTTDAKVVISSTWRKDNWSMVALINAFVDFGLHDRIIGRTPVIPLRYSRGKEILQWINDSKVEFDKFAILDDDENVLNADWQLTKFNIYESFFQTTEEYGLTQEVADSVVNFLT